MIQTIDERGKGGRKRQEVAANLRLLAQTLAPGDRLPSLSELERRFGVATGTVEAAVRQLRNEGILESRHGSGTYIARLAESVAPVACGTLAALVLSANPFYRACMEQLTQQAAQRGLTVVCRYADREMTPNDVFSLEALHPVGFVVFSHSLEWAASALIARGHRAVVVGVPPVGVLPTVPCVYGDNEYGAYLATRHLLEQGHRRFVYAHGFKNDDEFWKRRRAQGHERALREAGLIEPIRTLSAREIAAWRYDPESLRRYFAGQSAPTAVLVWIDYMAVDLLEGFRAAQITVPGDVSVVSYDNLLFSAHVQPPLDTVDPHLDVQIQQALGMLSAEPLQKNQVPTVVITPTFLKRSSSTRPAGRKSESAVSTSATSANQRALALAPRS